LNTHSPLRRQAVRWLILVLPLLALMMIARPEIIRVLRAGELPNDKRLGPLTELYTGYFPFVPPATPEEWKTRSEQVRRQVLVATGLWPMPERTPPNAVIHGRIDRGDYTVEKVFFQSYPGYFVAGNLYRPKNSKTTSGKLPGVLCPHGHWKNGRFYDAGEKELRQWLDSGAERFDPAGRFPVQSRCVQLARMGCVVFHYDMVGYADSKQLDHRAGSRPAMNTLKDWGFFSPAAESRLQTIMGLQTYNSIRALDWFSELPDVDPKRIAVTGCSGGGTQTFILCAIDPRPAVAFPAVMVSTAMQGGCSCENACYLRVDSGNVEFAALFAPRPLGMTAADDWTKEITTKGLPELQKLYAMLGVPDLVMAKPLLQFPHNYNCVSRAVMYQWLNQHLKLGLKEPIVEADYKPLSIAEMTVWDETHPKPAGGDAYERSLLRQLTEDSDRRMAALVPKDATSLAEYRRVVGGAVDVMIGRGLSKPGTIQSTARQERNLGPWRMATFLLRNATKQEETPAVLLRPRQPNDRVVIWVDKRGKQGLFNTRGKPIAAVERFLASGTTVLGLDLFGQGEATADGKPITKARLNKSGQEAWAKYAGYTFGYNRAVFAQRVHDILAAISFMKDEGRAKKGVYLLGLAGAGHWVAFARAQAGDAVDRAAIDTTGFRFANVAAIDDPDFLPGGAKYLDLPGIIAFSAGQDTWLSGEKNAAGVIRASYQASGKPDRLTLFADGNPTEKAVEWLLR
jgi:dienelactone hydrolase